MTMTKFIILKIAAMNKENMNHIITESHAYFIITQTHKKMPLTM